jgi:hypothetical protein
MRFAKHITNSFYLKNRFYHLNKTKCIFHTKKIKNDCESELSIYEEIYKNNENLIKIEEILKEKKESKKEEYIIESTIEIIENNYYK